MNGCGQCLRDCCILMIAVVLLSMILRNSNAYTTVYGPTVTLLEIILFWFFLWSVLWKMDIDKLDGLVLLILLNFESNWNEILGFILDLLSTKTLCFLFPTLTSSVITVICLSVCLFVCFFRRHYIKGKPVI